MHSNHPLLLETIKIEDGVIHNLSYHQQRCDKSRYALFHCQDKLELSVHIKAPQKGLYRCRITYSKHIHSIEYIPYSPKQVSSLKVVSSNLDYRYKFAKREVLNKLLSTHKDVDDIIIEKDGLLTDTSIANIAFYKNNQWYTPNTPLLEGTIRAKLLDDNFLTKADISVSELSNYTQVALMNAMIGFTILTDIQIQDTKGKTYDY